MAARAPWSLLSALLLVRLADEWVTFFPSGALEAIRTDLGLSYVEVGLVVASLPAGGLLGSAFSVAADFVDRRWLAAGGALGYALCMAAFALGGSLPLLLVAGFCWGAAGDAFVLGCEVALVDLYRDEVAPAIGRVNAFGAVGDLLGPLTLAAAAGLGLSWRVPFALGALAMLLYAAWLAGQRFPRPSPPPEAGSARQALLSVARDRRIVLLALVDGLYGLLDEPFLGFTVAFLERERAVPPALATLAISVAVAGGIVGFLSVPLFTARWSAPGLLRVLAAAMALEIGALVLAPFLPLQIAAIGALGVGGAVFYAVLKARYLSLRPGLAGTTKAVVTTVGHVGLAFPALVGATADAFSLAVGLGLYALVPLAILALLALGADRDRPDPVPR
jgi:FSR family fosmidomycin resistance protein-like MFS transporter